VRGNQHALISLFSAGAILAPLIPVLPFEWVMITLFGVFIGSLAPDADAADASIFHGRGKGVRILLPLFRCTIRYLIYCPISLILRIIIGEEASPRHRGFLHSFIGVALTSLLLTLYLRIVWQFLSFPGSTYLFIFGIGVFCGSLLHLLEDSCTPMGVAWGFPFRKGRVSGAIQTRNRGDLRPALFICVLALCTVIFAMGSLSVLPLLRDVSPLGAVASLGALWGAFLIIAGVRIHT
jgi:inner membrane protein